MFFYMLCFISAVCCFIFLKWLYSTRFQLALNAIRDDEEKAEAMGIHTNRYKTIAWSFAAFFLGISGGIFGNMTVSLNRWKWHFLQLLLAFSWYLWFCWEEKGLFGAL